MKCCSNCFTSRYINPIVETFSVEKGKCDFCHSDNVALCEAKELVYIFRNVLDLYSIKLSETSEKDRIEFRLQNDFPQPLFTLNDPVLINKLIQEIFDDEKEDYRGIFEEYVELRYMKEDHHSKKVENLKVSWTNFTNEIKFINRYHLSNILELSTLAKLLKRHSKSYKKGKIFYRARISPKTGHDKSSMGKPSPPSKATGGRANPRGISYLYLSKDVETTIYETRSTLFDYVTVVEFRLESDANIINLSEVNIYDPLIISESEELEDFLIHLPFISELSNELSKPLRRTDDELDYLPSQYLSEFIKHLGFDGIEYASSLNPKGYNLAFFSENKFQCLKTEIKEISELKYVYNNLGEK